MNRTDLQRLSRMRIRDAKVLLDAGQYAGSYYLAGYAVECAIKAAIAKIPSVPNSRTGSSSIKFIRMT